MMNTEDIKVWVAFTGKTELPFLKLLKKDFRHCFVVVHDGERWFSIDPLSNYMDVMVHNVPGEFDLPKWLAGRGYKMMKAKLDRTKTKMAPVLPFTCVEAVKRFLGIHAWHILTPWQLYQYLDRENNNYASVPTPHLTKETQYGQLACST